MATHEERLANFERWQINQNGSLHDMKVSMNSVDDKIDSVGMAVEHRIETLRKEVNIKVDKFIFALLTLALTTVVQLALLVVNLLRP